MPTAKSAKKNRSTEKKPSAEGPVTADANSSKNGESKNGESKNGDVSQHAVGGLNGSKEAIAEDEQNPPTVKSPEAESDSTGKEVAVPQDNSEHGSTVVGRVTAHGIIKLAEDAGSKFFQDQHGDAFAWIPSADADGHFECHKLRTKGLRARLLKLIKSKSEVPPLPGDIKQAIEILELNCHGAERLELANRRCVNDDRILIDLGDEQWRMIIVSSEEWRIEQQMRPYFYRAQHQRELPDPVRTGKVEELFEFVPADTDAERLLIIAWMIAALCPQVPIPILLIVGQQGSAKTTRTRRLRSLLDPSVTPVLGDIEMANLFLTFQHHAVPCFENVSRFNRRMADMFCRAVTGNGVERRKLFTDSDQVLYSFRRPIIINGIDTPSTRPDFIDRCVVINCQRMNKFRTTQELDREFESARPRLLGSMLDLLVKTLAVHKETPPADEFRMADFATFGRAVAVALGMSANDFDAAYRLNVRHQDFEVLEGTPMSRAVEKFARKHSPEKPWTGTADELLEQLRETVYVHSDARAKADLPKSARWLSSRLSELTTALAAKSVFVEKLPRTNTSRGWKVYSTDPIPPEDSEDVFEILKLAEDSPSA